MYSPTSYIWTLGGLSWCCRIVSTKFILRECPFKIQLFFVHKGTPTSIAIMFKGGMSYGRSLMYLLNIRDIWKLCSIFLLRTKIQKCSEESRWQSGNFTGKMIEWLSIVTAIPTVIGTAFIRLCVCNCVCTELGRIAPMDRNQIRNGGRRPNSCGGSYCARIFLWSSLL